MVSMVVDVEANTNTGVVRVLEAQAKAKAEAVPETDIAGICLCAVMAMEDTACTVAVTRLAITTIAVRPRVMDTTATTLRKDTAGFGGVW